ncbi:hypothetical protein GCM10010486_69880 [Nonomuraea roseoviolacea subsp. carminata]
MAMANTASTNAPTRSCVIPAATGSGSPNDPTPVTERNQGSRDADAREPPGGVSAAPRRG